MIEYFVIYGERHCGTNYLETLITGTSYYLKYDNPAFDIPVLNPSEPGNPYRFLNKYGSKHFFGYHDESIRKSSNCIFLCIVRNPYDWIIAMHKKQHHIPKINNSINNFLFNQWYSTTMCDGVEIEKKEVAEGKNIYVDRDYETGKRYKNIFAMRSSKLNYLYNIMPKLTKNYEFIKYEDLCKDHLGFVKKISTKYGLKYNTPMFEPINKEPYKISHKLKYIIDRNIDWQMEEQVGYFKKG